MSQPAMPDYYAQLEEALQQAKLDSSRTQREYTQLQNYNEQQQQVNLIQWQLDLQQELNRIQHFLRGDVIVTTAEGDEIWSQPSDKRNITLSSNGVDTLSNIISFLINKNLILSNFDVAEVGWKMKDFGDELADAVFLNYEFIFYKPEIEDLMEADLSLVQQLQLRYNKVFNADLSTLEGQIQRRLGEYLLSKIKYIQEKTVHDYEEEALTIYRGNLKKYPLIVNLLVQSVHATYNRALKGGERESLRRNVHVTQTQPLGQPAIPYTPSQKKFSFFRPSTWG